MNAALFFFLGLAAGAAGTAFYFIGRQKTGQKLADSQAEALLQKLESKLGSLSLEALSKSGDQLAKQAASQLEGKKELIDQQLGQMNEQLKKVSTLVTDLEKGSAQKFGELSKELKNTNEQTSALLQKTTSLNEVLANSRARGQLGEWMAEDVLRVAGFQEGINYLKQKMIEGVGSKPDFTFLLPKNAKLNMDVKFPLDNYMRFYNAKAPTEKDRYRADFFRDVKAKLKEITSRDYINPAQNTVDYVIFFVPNEQIFSFIQEEEPDMTSAALKNKVIFCSPVTLFAILAVIRQAVDNFGLEQTSNEILSLLSSFKAQWAKFVQKLETVGKRIDDAQKEYQTLTTTRRRQLERPLNEIEALRVQKGLPIGEPQAQLAASEDAETSPENE